MFVWPRCWEENGDRREEAAACVCPWSPHPGHSRVVLGSSFPAQPPGGKQLLREAGCRGLLSLPGLPSAPRVPGRMPLVQVAGGPAARTRPLPGATHRAVGRARGPGARDDPVPGLAPRWQAGPPPLTTAGDSAVLTGAHPLETGHGHGHGKLGHAWHSSQTSGGLTHCFWFQFKGRKVRASSGAPGRSERACALGTPGGPPRLSPRLWA